jgi:hypothetical protein
VHESGVVIGQASSLAETSTDGRTVTSRATTLATGISVAAVNIGAVKSVATMIGDGKKPQQLSDLVVTGLSVAGVPLSFGPQGVSLAGQSSPLPDNSAVAKSLAQQGVGLRYLEPIVTDDSVLSAGIEITTRYQPPDGSPFGLTTMSVTLGRSFVSLTSSGAGATESAGVTPAPDVDAAAAPGGTAALPATDAAALPGTLPGAVPAVPAAPAAVGGTVPTVQAAPTGLSGPDGFDLNLFPPFVVAALGVLLLGQLLRIRGVRQP